jgi:DNA-binding NtrC family response regulator
VGVAQLHPHSALGRSHWSVPNQPPTNEQRVLAVLVVDDSISFSKLIRETLGSLGLAVFDAKSPDDGLALFQAHQSQIGLAVIDLVTPKAGNLDLTAELDRLRPGLPVLYLVGAAKSVARCSIEAQAPGSVLAVPFTEEQLIGRVGGLLNIVAAPRQRHGDELWARLIAASDWISSGTAMLHVYELRQAELAEYHAATLSAGHVQHTFRTTNCDAAPYCVAVLAQNITHARWLIGQASAGGPLVVAA